MKKGGAAMVNDANTMEALSVSSDSPQIEQKPRLLDQVRNIIRNYLWFSPRPIV
jgi:hypothetical protein